MEKGFDTGFLLRELQKIRTVSDTQISYKAGEYKGLLPILVSALRASAAATPFKERCLRKALSHRDLKLDDFGDLTERCDKAYAEFLSTPRKPFLVFFDVTYTGVQVVTRLKDGDCTLIWQPSENTAYMKNIRKARKDLISLAGKHAKLERRDGMTVILAKVQAVDYEHAYDLARSSVDRLRGLINFITNRTRQLSLWGGLDHAVNMLRIGPFQSVHHEDGKAAVQQIWYDPHWYHDKPSIKFSGSSKEIQGKLRGWWRKMRTNDLKEHISDGLLRYCRALDQHDSDAALIGLWGALEMLTGTQNLNYDATVNRVQRVFPKSPITRQVAQHIRIRRNTQIHAARSPGVDEVDMVLRHAEMLVSGVLDFYIRFGKSFGSAQESFAFMDMELNDKKLRRIKSIINVALDYRSKAG